MRRLKDFILKVSSHALFKTAAFMMVIGTAAIGRCVVPLWHNEPEMPKSMLNEM